MTRVLYCTAALLGFLAALGSGETPNGPAAPASVAHGQPITEDAPESAVPAEVLAILREGEPLEFVSLHYDDLYEFQEGDEMLIRWKVLGRTKIDDADKRQQLIAALERGVAENDDGPADCFWPRHAFSTTHDGHRYDILVCFQCYQVEVYREGKKQSAYSFLIGRSPQPLFDQILTDAGVPLDSDADEE